MKFRVGDKVQIRGAYLEPEDGYYIVARVKGDLVTAQTRDRDYKVRLPSRGLVLQKRAEQVQRKPRSAHGRFSSGPAVARPVGPVTVEAVGDSFFVETPGVIGGNRVFKTRRAANAYAQRVSRRSAGGKRRKARAGSSKSALVRSVERLTR
jgi:hypothetical protein